MRITRKWAVPGLACLLFMVPAVVGANAPPVAEIDSPGGVAAAIFCGLFMGALGPVAGIIAGLISSCGWLLFDAIFL